jgi:nicotinamide mononucleotide transporter
MIEIIAATLGIASAVLAARKNIHTWTLSIASCALFLYVFLTAGLLSSFVLQLFYIAISVFGYVKWKLPDLNVHALTKDYGFLFPASMFVFVLSYANSWTMSTVQITDILLGSLSVVATFMLIHKNKYVWITWILIDIVGILLYTTTELYYTAGQYGLFLLNAIYGQYMWNKQ